MTSHAATVKDYLAQLPKDRRQIVTALRKVIRANLDKKIKEGIQYGAIGYFVPHSVYPAGYHCNPKEPLPVAGLASTKGHVALHLFCVYMTPELHSWFVDAWKKTGKKLDMGKACVRVKSLDDVPLDVVGSLFRKIAVGEFIDTYESSVSSSRPAKKKATKKKATKKKAAKKKTAKKKSAKKKSAKKKTTKKKAATKKPARASTKRVSPKKKAAPKRKRAAR